METLAIVGSLLENFNFASYIYYLGWAIGGYVVAYLFKLWEAAPAIKTHGGWQWGYFLKDNYKKWFAFFIASSLGILFTETVFLAIGIPGASINEITAIGMGGFTEAIIKRFFKGSDNRKV